MEGIITCCHEYTLVAGVKNMITEEDGSSTSQGLYRRQLASTMRDMRIVYAARR